MSFCRFVGACVGIAKIVLTKSSVNPKVSQSCEAMSFDSERVLGKLSSGEYAGDE